MKKYEQPVVEIIFIASEDVSLTLSNAGDGTIHDFGEEFGA